MIDLAFSKRNGALLRKQFVNRADEKTIEGRKGMERRFEKQGTRKIKFVKAGIDTGLRQKIMENKAK